MISYRFVTQGTTPGSPDGLYQVLVGSNGIFIHAERPGLQVIFPIVSGLAGAIPGLAHIEPQVRMTRIPASLMAEMALISSQSALEALFYLRFDGQGWSLHRPEQSAAPCSVQLRDPWAANGFLAEAHSHGELDAFFSMTDDEEEASGFRLYLVFGRRGKCALARIGVFGWFWMAPLDAVCEVPECLEEAYACGSEF